MTDYTLALFLHVVGALGLFIALGIEGLGLRSVRQAKTSDELGAWIPTLRGLDKIGGPSMLALLVTGFYMMATTWGWVPWITVTLGAIVLLFGVGLTITGRRMAAISPLATAAEAGPLSSELMSLLRQPILILSYRIRLAVALGIIFLMTVKPALAGALMSIVVAVIAGAVTTLPVLRRASAQPKIAPQETP